MTGEMDKYWSVCLPFSNEPLVFVTVCEPARDPYQLYHIHISLCPYPYQPLSALVFLQDG